MTIETTDTLSPQQFTPLPLDKRLKPKVMRVSKLVLVLVAAVVIGVVMVLVKSAAPTISKDPQRQLPRITLNWPRFPTRCLKPFKMPPMRFRYGNPHPHCQRRRIMTSKKSRRATCLKKPLRRHSHRRVWKCLQ